MRVLKIFDLKCSFNLHRLLKHLESYTSPMLHTELGNCYMQLKHYQEAMDQYGLALWYVLITHPYFVILICLQPEAHVCTYKQPFSCNFVVQG